MLLVKPSAEILAVSLEALQLIEVAGRTCYSLCTVYCLWILCRDADRETPGVDSETVGEFSTILARGYSERRENAEI